MYLQHMVRFDLENYKLCVYTDKVRWQMSVDLFALISFPGLSQNSIVCTYLCQLD